MSNRPVPLRRVARIINGGTPTPAPDNWDGDVQWATPVDLGSAGQYIEATQRTLTTQGLLTGSRTVPAGSIVLSTRAPIGYLAITGGKMAFNQGCRGLVPGPHTDPRFLAYQLSALRPDLEAAGQGSTFMELTSEVLGAIPVAAPPLDEQRRIADFLDDQVTLLDRAVELRQRQIMSLREGRAANVANVVGGANQPGAMAGRLPWLDRVPARWPVMKLTHVARLGSGHTPSRSHPEWWLDCTVPWITTGEVQGLRDDRVETLTNTREKISLLGLANSSAELRPIGTVVLSRTASPGYSAVMGVPMATSQDYVTWTCGPRLDPWYLLWCLRAMRQDLLGRLAMGSTHKTIYVPDIQTLKIPVPTLLEQRAIVACLRTFNASVDQAIDLDRRHMGLLNERKQTLITAAVTGQFDVTTAKSAA